MTYLEAIILGLVQGIAEFLPISSSGHLKLFEKLLGLPNVETDYILFDVLLHFGTLVAVLIVYHRVIADLLREALTMVHIRTPRAGETPDRPKRRMIALLIASLLPLFLILPVKDAMEKLGSSYLFIGIMLMKSNTRRGAKEATNIFHMVSTFCVTCRPDWYPAHFSSSQPFTTRNMISFTLLTRLTYFSAVKASVVSNRSGVCVKHSLFPSQGESGAFSFDNE